MLRAQFLMAILFSPATVLAYPSGQLLKEYQPSKQLQAAVSKKLSECNKDTKVRVDIGGEGGRDDNRVNCNIKGYGNSRQTPIPRLVPKTEKIPSPFADSSVDEVYIENVAVAQDILNEIVLDAGRIVKVGGIFFLLNPADSRAYQDAAIGAIKSAGYVLQIKRRTFTQRLVEELETTISVKEKP